MPKEKHRKRTVIPKMEGMVISDEDSTNDNASIGSTFSDSTIHEDANFAEEVDQTQDVVAFEDKLSEAIEGMFEKSVQSRISSIEFVITALMKRFIPDYVIRRRMTINDAVERSLRKGRGREQAVAAQLAVLLAIQLGSTGVVDEICQSLIPTLLVVVGDDSMPCMARAKCCWALSLLAFIGNYENVKEVMDTLRQTFSTLFLKNPAVNATSNAEETALYTAAISAWCLLLTVASSTDSFRLYLKQLVNLLDSNSVDVRMASGEVIAVILEQLRNFDGADEWEADDELVSKLKVLATDSHKFRAKKDRKTQRSAFRDIIRYIEEGELPKIKICFGQECLQLDTWCLKKQYDAFRQALGSGMNMHLKENDLLRDVLNLGEKVPLMSVMNKQSKLERSLMNAAAFKARSICRAKHRDKKIYAT